MTAASTQPARSVADLTAGVVLASVEIAAPPERVFHALTDPNVGTGLGGRARHHHHLSSRSHRGGYAPDAPP